MAITIRSAQRTSIPAYGMRQVRMRSADPIPRDCWMMVASRPSLAQKGILVDAMTVQHGGEMDLTAVVRNEGSQEVRIEKGQRLAQGVLLPCVDPSTVAGRDRGGRVASTREPD